ncbi:unnamed protein product, partial [Didymodactylos carnosus]
MAMTSSPGQEQSQLSSNLEGFILLWLDASVNGTEENIKAQHKLREVINQLKTFEDKEECEEHIRAIEDDQKIVLIVSERFVRELVPRIEHLPQLFSIYVHCFDKKLNNEWAKQHPKIKAVTVQLEELVSVIQKGQAKRVKEEEDLTCPLSVFNRAENKEESSSGLNSSFLYFQLLIDILLQMKYSPKSKQELIDLCNQQHKGYDKEPYSLREFDQTYSSDQALFWYTLDSFLYRVLNQALRTQNVDLLFAFGFVIKDIHEQLKQLQQSTNTDPILKLYRGQKMKTEELERIKESIGEFISMNSFLSTSRNRSVSLGFVSSASSSDDLQRVLFEISVDTRIKSRKPFANIQSLSFYDEEEEILFSIGSVFRIQQIHFDNEYQVSIIALTFCSDADNEYEELYQHMKQEACGNKETSLISLGRLLWKQGKYDQSINYYNRLLSELPENDPNIPICYDNLGNAASDQGDFDSAHHYYNRALDIYLKILPSDHTDLATCYNSIGELYREKGENQLSLQNYELALKIYNKKNDRRAAYCYNNMGIVYDKEEKYDLALDTYNKSLKINEQHLPPNHPDLIISYLNIGEVHLHMGEYDSALQNLEKALQIQIKALPSYHKAAAHIYEYMGMAYQLKHDYEQALFNLNKALDIYRHAVLPGHIDIVRTENSIQQLKAKF